jgi:hypothetical protein
VHLLVLNNQLISKMHGSTVKIIKINNIFFNFNFFMLGCALFSIILYLNASSYLLNQYCWVTVYNQTAIVTSSTYSTSSRMTKQTIMAPKVAKRHENEKMTTLLRAMLVFGPTTCAACTIQPRLLRMLNGWKMCTYECHGCREFRRREADRPVATLPFLPTYNIV